MSAASCRMCRQAGEKLFLKGGRCKGSKCAVENKEATPGQHGKKSSSRKLSEYGKQLQEKQKIKLLYGLREKPFRRLFSQALRMTGATGENILVLLERRLDNVLYRLKMAISRAHARQMIIHRHVIVNGLLVSSPSYTIEPGDEIAFSQALLKCTKLVENTIENRMSSAVKVPEWLELRKKERKGVVLRNPIRTDIKIPVEEQQIVEFYSK